MRMVNAKLNASKNEIGNANAVDNRRVRKRKKKEDEHEKITGL